MNDTLEAVLETLRREYLADAPGRITELQKDLRAFRAGEAGAAESLAGRFHRLAGSGGSYGFPEVSAIARGMERRLRGKDASPPPDADQVAAAIEELTRAFDVAGADLPVDAQPTHPPAFTWRARLIGPAGPERDAISAMLVECGYDVTSRTGRDAPEDIPLTGTPDLVVLVGGDPEADPYAIAAAWFTRRGMRPRGIVLVDDVDTVDRMRAVSSGIDVVLDRADAELHLPPFVKTLSRIGAPPARVVLVQRESPESRQIREWLFEANVEVTQVADPLRARDVVRERMPDLLVLDTDLPGSSGLTVARLIRQDPRFALLPIIYLANATDVASEVEAIRAGADDYVSRPLDGTLVLQLVLSRAERSRRIREMVHRDGLTGLLNHATLRAELQHAVDYGQRHTEPFGFLMIDVDHFKRVNDRYGHMAGDQVLVHLARALRDTVRASDLIGRYGGEEFGLILQRSDRVGAWVLAEKLRQTIATQPAVTPAGETIPITVSIGVASYPEDGWNAAMLVGAADRGLYRAKAMGRDRSEYDEKDRGEGTENRE